MKRFLSLVLVLVMLLSISPALVLEGDAAVEQISYVYGSTNKYKNVITNWGERGETATFLSQNAAAFYTAQDTSYAEMASLSGSTNRSSVPSSPLYRELQSIMRSAHKSTTSYDSTKELYKYTDSQNSSSSSISSFYSGTAIGPGWNQGPSWNREHTWPNSKGLGGADENDIMMLRPTATSENSSRGNTAYGESGGYYHPNSESGGKYDLRGDVARIMLYTYVRWGNTSRMWGTSGVMESEDVLLDWMEEDPVDTWELGRNDSVESITGTRNVFVDYPELAFVMFGEEIPADMSTPSGAASNGEVIPTTPVPTDPTLPTEPVLPDYVTAPETGKPYKFYIDQKTVNKTLYITGEMSGYYYATTEDITQAADVYLEAVSGGYRLYLLKDGVKNYLEIVKNGNYTNVVFAETPTKTLSWNAEIASVTCDVEGAEHYFGSYKEFVTFSASNISYVTGDKAAAFDNTSFVGHFLDVGGESQEPTDPTDPEPTDPTDPEPTDPIEPTDPTDPEPTDPTDPEPTDPIEPTDPTVPEPTDPVIPTQGTYEKITGMNQLTTGKYVLVADSGYAPGVYREGWLTAVEPVTEGNVITDTKGGEWTLTVNGDSVTLTDSNGVEVAPKGGNVNGITAGDYAWKVSFENGAFRFAGTGSDTVLLASNVGNDNMFRAYKTSTAANTESYPSYFTLYKLTASTPEEPPVEDPEQLPGDLDGNRQVTADDVVALLLYLSMPDLFPLPEGVNADFTGDGLVTADDAVKLLLHISMPDLFPL